MNDLSAEVAVSGSKAEIASAKSKVEAPNFASNLAWKMKLKDKSLMSLELSAPTGVEKKSKLMILMFFSLPFYFLLYLRRPLRAGRSGLVGVWAFWLWNRNRMPSWSEYCDHAGWKVLYGMWPTNLSK